MILWRNGPEIGRMGLLALIYFVAAEASLLLAVPPGYATPVWPPSGIALAALLLGGRRLWPGVWLGAALANLAVAGSPLVAALIATGNTLEAVVGTELLRRYAGGGRLETSEQVIKFAGAIAVSATIAAGIGVFAIALGKALVLSDVLLNAWTWWEGDAAGMIVVTPLILGWHAAGWPRWSWPKAIEATALAVALALVTLLVFADVVIPGTMFPLAFVPLAFVIWAAIRFGARGVTTATAIICAIAARFTLKGLGPWGAAPSQIALLVLLAYACTLVITGLMLAAIIRERERAMADLRDANAGLTHRVAERTQRLENANQALRAELEQRTRYEDALRQNEERFRLVVDGVKDYAIFSLDPDGNVASWSAGAQHIKGYAASEIIGTHFSRFYTAEDIARNWPAHELEVARAEGRFEDEGWRVRKDGSRFWANVVITALYDDLHHLRGFAKITRDLTVRRRIEALQETDRQTREFLAMLAHELRNPLAGIANALELMRRSPNAEHAGLRNVIQRQTTHLARIVDDLLDVSRITQGKIVLRKERLDLSEAVARAVESCRPSIDARKHVVDLQLAAQPVPVDADPTRLAQIVQNLVSNAVKYTAPGGRITITVARESGKAELRVRDSGIGIPPDLLPSVFDLFVQGDRSLDRTESGLGIGLTLVKRLAELHGGSVEASSGGPDAGSEFVVRLRLAERVIAPEPAGDTAQDPAPTRHRLLVVDDNRDSANTLAALFQMMGHDVRTAYDGPEALSIAADYRPHAMFLDIGLPGMNGYEVARKVRESPELAGTMLVAFTGYCQDEDRRRLAEVGFEHHVVKPAGIGELAKILDALPHSQ